MALANVGPGNGVLTLLSREEGETRKLTISPGTMVVLSTKYKYSYVPDGKSLTMRCWYLDYPQSFEITQHPDADLTQLEEFTEKGGTKMPRGDPVAICAMGTRYAFGAWEPAELWSLLRHAGVDTFIRHPETRWECDVYYRADADAASGLSYTEHGGFCDGMELFDNKFFDISPSESKSMDPTQRQCMEVAYISLAGGGYHKKQLMGKSMQIAMFAGIDKNEWTMMPKAWQQLLAEGGRRCCWKRKRDHFQSFLLHLQLEGRKYDHRHRVLCLLGMYAYSQALLVA